MWLTGPVAPRHVGSSQTRAQARVPCIGRQILNHCTTREAPDLSLYLSRFFPKRDRFIVFLTLFSKNMWHKESSCAVGILVYHFYFLSKNIIVIEYRLRLLLSFSSMVSWKAKIQKKMCTPQLVPEIQSPELPVSSSQCPR